MAKELVSIIIPTFNRAHLIKETLTSFIEQNYSTWEIIIVDDGSSDDTASVVQSISDTRIKYFKRSNTHQKGPSGCRNYGLSQAEGDLVLFFDDDDIAHPDLLLLCCREFGTTEIDFCRYERRIFYGNFDLRFDRGLEVEKFSVDTGDLEKMIINELPFNTCAVIWRKECFEQEKFNEDLFYADEWEFYQRILSQENIKGVNINKVLLFARKHQSSSTGNFLKANPKYLNSTRKAMKLVIQNLYANNRITPKIKKFFIRQGIALNDISIIEDILRKTNSGLVTRMKYIIGFKTYPLLKPYFSIKKKLTH